MADFYVRYYVGHKGKFGHEFLEFEFRPDGECLQIKGLTKARGVHSHLLCTNTCYWVKTKVKQSRPTNWSNGQATYQDKKNFAIG